MCARTSLQTRAPSGLSYAGVFGLHSLNYRESTTAHFQGKTSDALSLCCKATSQRAMSRVVDWKQGPPRIIRQLVSEVKASFPGGTTTHYVGSVVKVITRFNVWRHRKAVLPGVREGNRRWRTCQRKRKSWCVKNRPFEGTSEVESV